MGVSHQENLDYLRDRSLVTVGQAIRDAREAKGITQDDLSRITGIAQQNLSSIERGEHSMRISTLGRIALVLGPEAAVKALATAMKVADAALTPVQRAALEEVRRGTDHQPRNDQEPPRIARHRARASQANGPARLSAGAGLSRPGH